MHKSRFAGLIIDCHSDDLDVAAAFWSAALGAPVTLSDQPAAGPYAELTMPEGDHYVEVQKVDHDSRVHLDIEADNIEAEVARLESLGAKRLAAIKDWVVMQAPTGQRFCVVPVVRAGFEENANTWGD